MPEFYVLCRPWAVFVKEKSFFLEQEGNTQDWGKGWQLLEADSIEDARLKGQAIVSRAHLVHDEYDGDILDGKK